MTQSEIRELACTDQVRKGRKLGMVVCTKGALKILWDDDEEPETYPYDDAGELTRAAIARKAFRAVRNGVTIGFHTRVAGG